MKRIYADAAWTYICLSTADTSTAEIEVARKGTSAIKEILDSIKRWERGSPAENIMSFMDSPTKATIVEDYVSYMCAVENATWWSRAWVSIL
jgi:hypothetical protein